MSDISIKSVAKTGPYNGTGTVEGTIQTQYDCHALVSITSMRSYIPQIIIILFRKISRSSRLNKLVRQPRLYTQWIESTL